MKKQRNVREKSEQNLQKWRLPAYFRHFRPEKNFYQKSDSAILWALLICIFVQKNAKKTNDEIENRAQSHFRHWHFASVCQISCKNTAREIQEIPFFRRKSAVPAIFRKFRLRKLV